MKPAILVIGGGFTGLTAAHRLLHHADCDVTLVERSESLGGLAGDFKLGGYAIEKAYHHIFRTDRDILALITELGLAGDMLWQESSMAIRVGGGVHPFSSPEDLLAFKPLSLFSRLRLGAVVFYLQRYKNGTRLGNKSAAAWMRRAAGKAASEVIWDPLLKGKFSSYAEDVSMAWLWARIHIRANSRDKGGGKERLGYLGGGFGRVAQRLDEVIRAHGGKVQTAATVERIRSLATGWEASINGETRSFAAVAFTGSNRSFATMLERNDLGTAAYLGQLRSIAYLNAACLVFSSAQDLGGAYWTNINEAGAPFLVFINHTKLLPNQLYGGQHIYYIGAYLHPGETLWKMEDATLEETWFDYLKRLFPDFDSKQIKEKHLFRFQDAQHVVDRGYESRIPSMDTPIKGLYLSNFSQIFPEDRGTNYAVREGNHLAARIRSHLGLRTS